jgi:oxygen-independent coproporphyrinogen-3 oxidase
MYYALVERAEAEGYEHYEISNFSLPGFESRHNLKYWSDVPYVGFGCSAHSYDGRERRSNVLTPTAYLNAMRLRDDPVEERTRVTDETRRQEALLLGLRRLSGVDLNAFESQYGVDVMVEYGAKLAPLVEAGLVETNQGWLRLTRRGLVLANEVFAVFV